MDEQAGRLYLAHALTEQSIGSYALTVTVSDTAKHTNSIELTVIINEEATPSALAMEEGKVGNKSIITISILAAAILIVAVLAGTAFIKLRKQVQVEINHIVRIVA